MNRLFNRARRLLRARVVRRLNAAVDQHYASLPAWVHEAAKPAPSAVPVVSPW